jgi:hypothetical protein
MYTANVPLASKMQEANEWSSIIDRLVANLATSTVVLGMNLRPRPDVHRRLTVKPKMPSTPLGFSTFLQVVTLV